MTPTPPPTPAPKQLIVMGVAGAGKTTVAERLAQRLGCEVADADEFHPAANIAKMTAGIPLTDEDRWPWLEAIAGWIRDRDQAGRTAVVTCSALKRAYRRRLLAASPRAIFVHLTGTAELLARRIAGRHGHFMSPAMLASQLAILEPLGPDEPGLTIDVAPSPDELARGIVDALGLEPVPGPQP